MLGSSIVTPVLPLYARDFGVSYAGAGLLISAFAVGRLLFDYAGGLLADRFGARRLATAGALVVALSAYLSALAPDFRTLVGFRVLEGIGSAIYVTTAMALLGRTVDAARMGQAMGFYQSLILLGVSFGPTIGGVVAEVTGDRRAPFLMMSAVGVGVAVLSFAVLPRSDRGPATERAPRPPLASVVRLARQPAFAFALLLTFFVFAVRAGLRVNLIPLFGEERGGLGEAAIGIVLSASAFANFAVLWHAGALIDRLGRRAVALPTLAATAAVCAAHAWSPSFGNLLVQGALLGAVLGYLAPAPAAMVADLTPREMMGAVMGVYRMGGDLGLLLGPISLGAIASAAGFEAAFLAAAAAAVLTLVAGLAVPETLASVAEHGSVAIGSAQLAQAEADRGHAP
ncbi:MAG: transporter, family, multidrug resistance protein [Candidatus Binatota bacterium]|nr:transporter, family, multidrug resistance protein [Candidatus Binatota bacterium]